MSSLRTHWDRRRREEAGAGSSSDRRKIGQESATCGAPLTGPAIRAAFRQDSAQTASARRLRRRSICRHVVQAVVFMDAARHSASSLAALSHDAFGIR